MPTVAAPARRTPIQQQFVLPPDRPKRQLRLFFPRETWALRTQFRIYALQFLYGIAEAELGSRLRSASVSMWSQPGEEDSEHLVLTIAADTDWAALNPIRDNMITAVCEEAENWTEEDRHDYAKRVYFELVPLAV